MLDIQTPAVRSSTSTTDQKPMSISAGPEIHIIVEIIGPVLNLSRSSLFIQLLRNLVNDESDTGDAIREALDNAGIDYRDIQWPAVTAYRRPYQRKGKGSEAPSQEDTGPTQSNGKPGLSVDISARETTGAGG